MFSIYNTQHQKIHLPIYNNWCLNVLCMYMYACICIFERVSLVVGYKWCVLSPAVTTY